VQHFWSDVYEGGIVFMTVLAVFFAMMLLRDVIQDQMVLPLPIVNAPPIADREDPIEPIQNAPAPPIADREALVEPIQNAPAPPIPPQQLPIAFPTDVENAPPLPNQQPLLGNPMGKRPETPPTPIQHKRTRSPSSVSPVRGYRFAPGSSSDQTSDQSSNQSSDQNQENEAVNNALSETLRLLENTAQFDIRADAPELENQVVVEEPAHDDIDGDDDSDEWSDASDNEEAEEIRDPLPARQGENLVNARNNDDDDDADALGILELLGFQGPLANIVGSIVWTVVCTFFIIGAGLWFPWILGRMIVAIPEMVLLAIRVELDITRYLLSPIVRMFSDHILTI
jgi:hypothetical protein